MSISEHTAAGLHTLSLAGEVDLHHSTELRAALAALAEAKCPALLVDLSEVTYIDSAGLATLIEYVQRSAAFRGRLALGGVPARVRTIFDLARLGEIFSLHATVAEAQAALRA
jgi:anti-sigma B factor antagonist